jgi:hypothetical protein
MIERPACAMPVAFRIAAGPGIVGEQASGAADSVRRTAQDLRTIELPRLGELAGSRDLLWRIAELPARAANEGAV